MFFIPAAEKRRAVVGEGTADESDSHNLIILDNCVGCPLPQWGDAGSKPPCRLSYNWAALLEEGDPVLIRFGGSAAKISAKLRNLPVLPQPSASRCMWRWVPTSRKATAVTIGCLTSCRSKTFRWLI